MSAAAVIAGRIKRIFSFLREQEALSAESAVAESEVPYSDRWYYDRLVRYGAVKRVGEKCYLDETLAQTYIAERRKRALVFLVSASVVFCLLWLIWTLM